MKRVNRTILFFLLALFTTNSFASELKLQWDWMISAQTNTPQQNAFATTANKSRQNINALLDLQLNYQAFSGLFAIKGNDLYHSDSNQDADTEFIVSELFWQNSVELAGYSLDLQLGKVRVDWGVGYGYRPLDIFTPYRRNPVGIQVEEGAGIASISYFDSLGEWTLIYSNSSLNQQHGSEIEEQSEQQGVGVRRYGLIADTEYQTIIYYDDLRQGLLGGSIVTVLDNAWEFHGSATYQQHYLTYQQQQHPISLTEQQNGYQALVGLTWTDIIGNTVILEYWYDSRAWDADQWQNAINDGSPAYLQGYLHSNIVAHNIMAHWSLDSNIWSNWQRSQGSWLKDFTPSIDLLYSPQDNGVIATQWLNYLLHDSGESKTEIQLAARFFTGNSTSAYANMPDKHTILVNLKGRF
ncbi:MAG: hypothetical protein GY951_13730 [Psychromonas sp.]|nr:hypothetical protein [Psychromonas sp.]